MKRIFNWVIPALVILCACNFLVNEKPVTRAADYLHLLQPQRTISPMERIDGEIAFWQKRFERTPDDLTARSKIAGLLCHRFSYSGKIEELVKADSLYKLANKLNGKSSSSTYRSMAMLCITRHQFQQASLYIDSALTLGDDRYQSLLVEFDVALELGNTYKARKVLQTLSPKTNFEYYIRASKFADKVDGNLALGIDWMEKAWNEIKHDSSSPLWSWTRTNLGDLYSHAHQYQQSYQCYLEVLRKDPNYFHAWKGIAWLAFSHDHNSGAARQIINYLKEIHPIPDYELLLAEINMYEGKALESQAYREAFINKVQNMMYGDMYNKYQYKLRVLDDSRVAEALKIAREEVDNRQTGESFGWLAYAHLKNGNRQKAIDIARLYVEGKCFEPETQYYLGQIYLETGHKHKARRFLEEALAGSYELGPETTKRIRAELDKL